MDLQRWRTYFPGASAIAGIDPSPIELISLGGATNLGRTLKEVRLLRGDVDVVGLVDEAVARRVHNVGAQSGNLVEDNADMLVALRARSLDQGQPLTWDERGAVLALLGSAERAFFLIERIQSERQSVSRDLVRFEATPVHAGVRMQTVPAAG